MARRHGWELPAHSFQVVAITVFCLLSVAFYAFFAPFLGKNIYEYIATGIYSFLALSVLVLYVRCTAIDPADPGILIEVDKSSAHDVSNTGTEVPSGNLSTTEEPTKSGLKNGGNTYRHDNTGWCSKLGGCLCFFVVKEDCRKDEDELPEQNEEDEALFCTLCKAEVGKFSKHCRSCDKCVEGFDHHCRWLNNCVGRKNYFSFICLMAASLAWLVFECAIGILVLVRCFLDKKATENDITDRLGDGFSRPPFATVVALCTALSLLATVPLGELFFFHIILLRKGISTYEYVVAMRAQSEAPGISADGEHEHQSLSSSPTSSFVTAISGRSSAGKGLQYKGAWCTPPRIFMDQQDEIVPHLEPGQLPSTVDPDTMQPDKGKQVAQRPVRISAWKLAKLDSTEARKAGAKARTSSSVLRPIGSKPHHYETDYVSSSKSSPVSTNKSPYPPSRASNLSSPQSMNLSPTPGLNTSNLPISTGPSRLPGLNRGSSGPDESVKSVYWDPEAGRFVSAATRSVGSSLQGLGTGLMYTGQSIFFGSPVSNEQMNRGMRPAGSTGAGTQRSSTVSYYQQGRSRRGGQLPVFVPSDSQQQN